MPRQHRIIWCFPHPTPPSSRNCSTNITPYIRLICSRSQCPRNRKIQWRRNLATAAATPPPRRRARRATKSSWTRARGTGTCGWWSALPSSHAPCRTTTATHSPTPRPDLSSVKSPSPSIRCCLMTIPLPRYTTVRIRSICIYVLTCRVLFPFLHFDFTDSGFWVFFFFFLCVCWFACADNYYYYFGLRVWFCMHGFFV